MDAFEVLGLAYDPDLTDGQVHDAYLLRLRAVHPDSGGDEVCAAAVTAAYSALRSGVRRAELLAAVWPGVLARQGAGRERAGRHPWPGDVEREMDRPPGGGSAPDEARRAELRREVAESRRAQGLPPYITDEATLDKIAELLAVVLGRDVGPREQAGRPAVRHGELAREYARAGAAPSAGPGGWWLGRGWLRVRHGRPAFLAARVAVAAAVPVAGYLAAPGFPAWPGLAAGALT